MIYFTNLPKKTFALPAYYNNYPHPYIIGNFRSHQKILYVLSKITTNWLGEEGTMHCYPFCFIFNPI